MDAAPRLREMTLPLVGNADVICKAFLATLEDDGDRAPDAEDAALILNLVTSEAERRTPNKLNQREELETDPV